MSRIQDLKVSTAEANIADVILENKSYGVVTELLKNRDLIILFECCMSGLTVFEKTLYETVIAKTPREIALFLDPMIISFALRDACDVSEVDYVWLDLESDDEIGCSAWVNEKDGDFVVSIAVDLLGRHLEKYIIDVYDRETREDMAKAWEAGFNLQECPICEHPLLERRTIVMNTHGFRGWTCLGCGHHVVVPSDTLDYLTRKTGVSS